MRKNGKGKEEILGKIVKKCKKIRKMKNVRWEGQKKAEGPFFLFLFLLFCFLFHLIFWKPLKLFWVYQNGTLTGKRLKQRREKIGKSDFAPIHTPPPEKFSCYALLNLLQTWFTVSGTVSSSVMLIKQPLSSSTWF